MVTFLITNGLRFDGCSVTLGENDIDSNATGDYRANKYQFTGEVRTDWVEKGGSLLATFTFPEPRFYDLATKTTIIPFVLDATETAKIPYLPTKKDPSAVPIPTKNAHVFEIRATNLETGFTYSVFQGYIEMGVSGVANGD